MTVFTSINGRSLSTRGHRRARFSSLKVILLFRISLPDRHDLYQGVYNLNSDQEIFAGDFILLFLLFQSPVFRLRSSR